MKYGLIFSLILVLTAGLLLRFVVFPPADPPTGRTSLDRLTPIDLPIDLPRLYTPDGDGSAGVKYDQAVALYRANRLAFEGTVFEPGLFGQAAKLLIAAARAPVVTPGFLDTDTPIQVGGGPTDHPLYAVAAKVLVLSDQQQTDGQTEQARAAALAVFTLGERAYRHNVLLGSRQLGLMMMIDAGNALFELNDPDTPQAEAVWIWADALGTVSDSWANRLEIIQSIDPPAGDLLHLARHDPARTFRVAATAQCGVGKFTTDHRGNKRAIRAYLTQAMNNDDPLIVQAATAADALTVDDLHRLR